MQHISKLRSGFTLVELVVYMALLVVVSVFLIQTLLALSVAYRKLQYERDVVSSARLAMETVGREVRASKSIYTPTSIFNATSGQLSLESPLNPNAGENTTYVDFYLDNKRLYMKREGSSTVPLTSEGAEVRQFFVSRVTSGVSESARIVLQVFSRAGGNLQSSTTITASFTPRGNY